MNSIKDYHIYNYYNSTQDPSSIFYMFETVRYLGKMWTAQYSWFLFIAVSCHTLLDKKVSIRAFCLWDKLVYCKVMGGVGSGHIQDHDPPCCFTYCTLLPILTVYKTVLLYQVHSQFQCQHHGYHVQARKCYSSSVRASLWSILAV